MLKLSNDLGRQVRKAVEYPFNDKRTDKSLLIALHGEVFSSKLCKTCENEQIRAYIELYRLINPKEKDMNPPSKKYRFNPLREGETVSIPKKRWTVTASTLTDEQAKHLIESGYERLILTVDEAEAVREQFKETPVEKKSGDMTAKESVEYIEKTSVEELSDFLSDGEERKSVLAAWNEKNL